MKSDEKALSDEELKNFVGEPQLSNPEPTPEMVPVLALWEPEARLIKVAQRVSAKLALAN